MPNSNYSEIGLENGSSSHFRKSPWFVPSELPAARRLSDPIVAIVWIAIPFWLARVGLCGIGTHLARDRQAEENRC
jgi:hypothetical protein